MIETPAAPAVITAPGSPAHNSRALGGRWGWVLLRGLLAIVAGVLALLAPPLALVSLVLVFGAYAAADGVLSIVAAIRAGSSGGRWGWLLLEGVVSLGAATAALLLPGVALFTFVMLLAAWAIVTGIALIIQAFRIDHGRRWLVLGGLVSLVWGVLVLVFPGAGALALAIWFGAYALAFGVALTVLALRLKALNAGAAGG